MKLTRGFTLLEILIVVVIIGILAGLAIPKFNKSIESAKGKEAYVVLETIRTAERMYYLDHGNYTATISPGVDFTLPQYLAGYLVENPNYNWQEKNWAYRFNVPGYPPYTAQRVSGKWNGDRVGMDWNGNMVDGINTDWPWPPN